jgi:HD-GYP domain-containing protein (c-di-GMP phosphodiesterase class II)
MDVDVRLSELERELAQAREDLADLNRIGMALMTERDADVLLRRIVLEVMRFTTSDAGALFLLERNPLDEPVLRFKIIHCESARAVDSLETLVYPLQSRTIVGYVAATRTPLVINDVNDLPPTAPYELNPLIEQKYGYRIKSVLSIPMINHRGDVVGVLQLANRKTKPVRLLGTHDVESFVVPFSHRDVQVALSLGGQAAVSMENTQLRAQVETLFESFVKAAVTAIDQRDPATAGHSIRVATLVADLAAAVDRCDVAPYASVRFTRQQLRELHYAALLHDFGKIGVREELLLKARKLPPLLWERLQARFALMRCASQARYQERRANLLGHAADAGALRELEAEYLEEQRRLEELCSEVRAANEPSMLAAGTNDLHAIAGRMFTGADGRPQPCVTAEELHYLNIPSGCLDEGERTEIETHATHTFDFLAHIPWTEDLTHVAEFAGGHHEKLNGTGYPRQLHAADIPVQMRILAIADIFDALTAHDRPYKPALSPDTALQIMRAEAAAGLLDADLIDILASSRAYERALTQDWRHL